MTDKIRQFCEVYFSTGCNCLQAFMATHPNQTLKSARSNAYKFIKKPEVEAALEEWREQTRSRTEHAVTALEEHLLQRIFYDYRDYLKVDPNGFISIADFEKMPAEAGHIIKGIEVTDGGVIPVMENRDKAIELFCKMHGLTKEKIDLDLKPTEKFAHVIEQLGGGVFDDED